MTRTTSDARVRFDNTLSTSGFIDAAWWPRSRDLAAELPALLDALPASTQPITRVSYMLAAWDSPPRRTTVGTRVVRLSGYAYGDPDTISLWDSWGRQRIDLLVIPPATDPALAESIMTIAGRADSLLRASEILAEAGAS